jgi:hypothetical protein
VRNHEIDELDRIPCRAATTTVTDIWVGDALAPDQDVINKQKGLLSRPDINSDKRKCKKDGVVRAEPCKGLSQKGRTTKLVVATQDGPETATLGDTARALPAGHVPTDTNESVGDIEGGHH